MNPGQQLTPTLKLVRPLGKGAMGSVWIAEHLTLGTQVAVKLMVPELAQDPGFVERFRREAMAAAQIKHPHVAQVFDHGVTVDGALYIAMELLEGETLQARLNRLGPLPLLEVVRIVGQTAKALGRAHQLGIVHRDIKPDNLFVLDLDGEPFVKILDFGVAKLAHGNALSATSTGSLLGTPLYMSPEQLLSSKHVDHHADLWALAVVAYQAITGRVPFNGDTLGALSVAVHTGVFPLPSSLRPDVPPAIDAWAATALQRDPNARFHTAKELAEALEQAAGIPRAAMASSPAWRPPAGLSATQLAPPQDQPAAPQSGTPVASEGRSSTPSLRGSGAGAVTFHGLATTDARGKRRAAPVVLGAVFAGAVVAIGAGALLLRPGGGAGQDEAVTEGPAGAASTPEGTAAAAQPAPERIEAANGTPSITTTTTTTTGEAATLSSAPSSTALGSAPAPAMTAPPAQQAPNAAQIQAGTAETRPPQATAKPAADKPSQPVAKSMEKQSPQPTAKPTANKSSQPAAKPAAERIAPKPSVKRPSDDIGF